MTIINHECYISLEVAKLLKKALELILEEGE